ncbi:MAG: tetratricopeptide repeat protein [Candidatus Heimdallarchaeaceae archaeon]
MGRSIKKEGEKIKRKLLPIPGDARSFEIQNIEHIKLFSAERLDFKKFLIKLEKQKQQPLLKIIINPKTKFCKIELMNKDNPTSPYNITAGGDILEFTYTYRFLFKHGYIKIENNYPLLLSDKQRIVWYLREKIELTFVDIAFAMDETVRNVRNLFNQAEKRINQILDFVVDEEHYQLVAAHAMKRKGVRIQQIGDTIIEPKITEKYLIEQQQLEELTHIEELEKKVEIPREWVIKTAYKIETLEGGYYLWKEFLGALNKDSLLMIENDSLPHEEEYLINAIGLGGEIIPDIKSNFKKLIDIFSEAPDELVKIGDTAFFMGYMDNIYSSQFWNIRNFVKGNRKNWKKDFVKIAIKAYSKALEKINPAVYPVKYGVLKNDLGVFYFFLSELEQTKKNTLEAIKNMQEAKNALPLEFFKTKHSDICYNLGLAHLLISKIENKEENIKQAILNFNFALQGRTLRMYPLKYAITQVNLGIVYQKLAEIEETSLNCTLSIESYNNALRSNTLDIMPTEAAMIYNNIGLAYCTLSKEQETEYNISQALIVLNDALTIRNEAQFPVEYAITTSILGKAYTILATVKETKKNYEKAISAFNKAIRIFIKKYEDFYQAIIHEKEKIEEKLIDISQ